MEQSKINPRVAIEGLNKKLDQKNCSITKKKTLSFNSSDKKIKPAFYSELYFYPNANPILISIDWKCLNYIREHHGICLLCNKNSEFYDFSFCELKDILILYSQESNHFLAMRLAYTILRFNPKEVRVIPFCNELLEEEDFV